MRVVDRQNVSQTQAVASRSGEMTLDQQIEEVEIKIHKMWDSFPRRDTELLGLVQDVVELVKRSARDKGEKKDE